MSLPRLLLTTKTFPEPKFRQQKEKIEEYLDWASERGCCFLFRPLLIFFSSVVIISAAATSSATITTTTTATTTCTIAYTSAASGYSIFSIIVSKFLYIVFFFIMTIYPLICLLPVYRFVHQTYFSLVDFCLSVCLSTFGWVGGWLGGRRYEGSFYFSLFYFLFFFV